MSRLRFASAAVLAGALLTIPGSMLVARPAPPTVTITIGSHFYRPNPIRLTGGVPVRLVFVNRAGGPHDFKAPQFVPVGADPLTGAAQAAKSSWPPVAVRPSPWCPARPLQGPLQQAFHACSECRDGSLSLAADGAALFEPPSDAPEDERPSRRSIMTDGRRTKNANRLMDPA